MPIKFRNKQYESDSVYHIYNRGIDGKEIFCEEEDYLKFLDLLAKYLQFSEVEDDLRYKKERPNVLKHKKAMNLNGEVEILAFCLLPDHFHILIWQKNPEGITKLIRRVLTGYVMYYNKKYLRKGTLFENIFRAVLIEGKERILAIIKYIHQNPKTKQIKRFGLVETVSGMSPEYYLYSSYRYYLNQEQQIVILQNKLQEIIGNKNINEMLQNVNRNDEELIRGLTLE